MLKKRWTHKGRAAEAALARSRDDLEAAATRAAEARTLADVIRRMQRENHFGPDLRRVFEGGA